MLKKVNTPGFGTGFQHKLNKILNEKCRAHIAEGSFTDADIPTMKKDLHDLYNGVSAPFNPFGDLDGTGSKISWTEKTYELDFTTVGLNVEVTGSLVSVTITSDSLKFASNLGQKEYSLLIVPDGTDNIFFALSGVTLTTEGDLGIVENDHVSKITYKIFRKANKIEDVVKFKELETA
jgi:hypothetical protein